MMGTVSQRIGIAALIGAATFLAAGFLVAALVAWLASLLGLPAALALTGLGFLAVALVLGLVLRSLIRAAERRRRSQTALVGLVELALTILPRKELRRLEASVAAGVGLAALLAALLRPNSGRADRDREQGAPAADDPQT